jgi:hypothetical protein
MAEKTLTPRDLLRQIIAQVAREFCLEPDLLFEPRPRSRVVKKARAVVAKRLFKRQVPEDRIARMMHISLTDARIYLGRLKPRESKSHEQNGTEGSSAARTARGQGGGEQAPDRHQDNQVEGEGDRQGRQRQGEAHRSRAMR